VFDIEFRGLRIPQFREALAKSKSDVLEPISKMRSILKLAPGRFI
jgi:hypothetical protein